MIVRTVACAALAALTLGAAASAQNYALNPNFGTFSLNAGFLPDPYNVNVVAGGNINASRLGSGCVGSISDAPDVRLNFNGGRISIGAQSGSDTTIVVNGPDGRWYCNDDFDGLNPRVTISGSGQYDCLGRHLFGRHGQCGGVFHRVLGPGFPAPQTRKARHCRAFFCGDEPGPPTPPCCRPIHRARRGRSSSRGD